MVKLSFEYVLFQWNLCTQCYGQYAVSIVRTLVMPRNWNSCLIDIASSMIWCWTVRSLLWWLDLALFHCLYTQIECFNDALCLKTNLSFWRCFALKKNLIMIWFWTFQVIWCCIVSSSEYKQITLFKCALHLKQLGLRNWLTSSTARAVWLHAIGNVALLITFVTKDDFGLVTSVSFDSNTAVTAQAIFQCYHPFLVPSRQISQQVCNG